MPGQCDLLLEWSSAQRRTFCTLLRHLMRHSQRSNVGVTDAGSAFRCSTAGADHSRIKHLPLE